MKRGPEGEQCLANLSFVLEPELVDGEWLVDAVAPVPVAEVVGGDAPATPTEPTEPAPPSEPAPPTTSDAPPPTGG